MEPSSAVSPLRSSLMSWYTDLIWYQYHNLKSADVQSQIVGDVLDIENGEVSFYQASGRNKTQFESVANYSCSDGYALTESGLRMCQSNGNWSGPIPACSEGQKTS